MQVSVPSVAGLCLHRCKTRFLDTRCVEPCAHVRPRAPTCTYRKIKLMTRSFDCRRHAGLDQGLVFDPASETWKASVAYAQPEQVAVLMWAPSLCNARSIHTEPGRGGRLGTDRNSCAQNEECSVFKGLTDTQEVCFHSLIQERRGHYRTTQTSG